MEASQVQFSYHTWTTLQRALDKDVKESGLKIKIVEMNGFNMKIMSQRSNCFKHMSYERDACLVCQIGGSSPCDATGVTYEIICKECEMRNVGETLRSAKGTNNLSLRHNRKETWRNNIRFCYECHGSIWKLIKADH